MSQQNVSPCYFLLHWLRKRSGRTVLIVAQFSIRMVHLHTAATALFLPPDRPASVDTERCCFVLQFGVKCSRVLHTFSTFIAKCCRVEHLVLPSCRSFPPQRQLHSVVSVFPLAELATSCTDYSAVAKTAQVFMSSFLRVRFSWLWSHKTWTWLTPSSLAACQKRSTEEGGCNPMWPPSSTGQPAPSGPTAVF